MCVKTLMKIISGVLSIVFMVLGIVFLIVGFILQFGLTTVVVNYVKTYVNQLNGVLSATGTTINIEEYIKYLPDITGNLAVTFIIMGAITAGIGLVGLIAVCCEVKVLLIVYIAILAVLIVGQIVLVIIYYAARGTFVSRAKEYMQQTINEKYTGYNNTNMETILWNIFHLSLSCCGISSGADFTNATKWTRTVSYSGVSYINMAYPLTCCKTDNYTACLSTNHTDTRYSNQNVGCWDKIDNVVQMNVTYAALGTAAVILLQVIIMLFAIHLCKDSSKTAPV